MVVPMRWMFSLIVLAGLTAGLMMAVWLPASALELDRLRMLNSAEHVPWRGVGRVNIEISSRSLSMCTGTLIGEDLVLTAAHCVMNPQSGTTYKPGNVHFVAGWRLGQKVAHSKAAAITVHPDYVYAERVAAIRIGSDLALIRLADPVPQAKAPFFSIAPVPGSDTPLTLISYRQDRPHALTRQQGCEIIGSIDAVIAMDCNVTFGASGSPVFMSSGDEMRLVAVISAMSEHDGRKIAYAVAVDAAIGEVLGALE
jgi:protease YdgD